MTSASRPRSLSGPAEPPMRTPARPRTCSTTGSPPGLKARRSRVADPSERTAAEREAARVEREHRRRQGPGEAPSHVEPPAPDDGASPASDGNGVGAGREWEGAAVRTESHTEHADLDVYDSLAQGAELNGDADMDDD